MRDRRQFFRLARSSSLMTAANWIAKIIFPTGGIPPFRGQYRKIFKRLVLLRRMALKLFKNQTAHLGGLAPSISRRPSRSGAPSPPGTARVDGQYVLCIRGCRVAVCPIRCRPARPR